MTTTTLAAPEPSRSVLETVSLELRGRIPSKKNRWRNFGRLPKKDRDDLEALGWQIASQWGPRPPRLHPEVTWYFRFGSRRRRDRDNAAATLRDLLVKCRVIVDDDIEHYNGVERYEPAEAGAVEDGVRIAIGPGAVDLTPAGVVSDG